MSTQRAPRAGMTDAAGPQAGPRIVMTLLVRDEEDILVQNIEYHRALGVDHFIITDNLSKDRTPSIIQQHYVRKGWASSIFEIEDDYSPPRPCPCRCLCPADRSDRRTGSGSGDP
jgi:hypothetical protein